ncbi:prepilin peptidase [Serratia symbiotica]|uniref:prepilin peptidase n=1 Tax=Serratia symbiotica TaxID=138074 RepID=UPI001E38A8C8|nr:A24 family peptidase [Serratia symbiotica]
MADQRYLSTRQQPGVGQGDFKLLAALGAWIGWGALPLLVSLAAAAGLCATLAPALWGHKIAWRAPLPFGSWLVLLVKASPHAITFLG